MPESHMPLALQVFLGTLPFGLTVILLILRIQKYIVVMSFKVDLLWKEYEQRQDAMPHVHARLGDRPRSDRHFVRPPQ